MNKNLTIAIPLSRDKRVFQCLDSIDMKCEVIVVLNGSYDKSIERRLNERDIKILKMRKFSFSKFYNLIIKKSKFDKIFFMDSDCIFVKGALSKLNKKMKNFLIIKGKINFLYNSLQTYITAKAREFTTSDPPNLYIPGLIFNKKLFHKIGFFNENINYCADAEMAKRIFKSGIKWKNEHISLINHDPVLFKEDLRSAFRYGIGIAERSSFDEINFMRRLLKDPWIYLANGIKIKGILVGLYLFLWSIVLNLGMTKMLVLKKIN